MPPGPSNYHFIKVATLIRLELPATVTHLKDTCSSLSMYKNHCEYSSMYECQYTPVIPTLKKTKGSRVQDHSWPRTYQDQLGLQEILPQKNKITIIKNSFLGGGGRDMVSLSSPSFPGTLQSRLDLNLKIYPPLPPKCQDKGVPPTSPFLVSYRTI